MYAEEVRFKNETTAMIFFLRIAFAVKHINMKALYNQIFVDFKIDLILS